MHTALHVTKNPLLLLVVSGCITAFLAPFVTVRWQNHQQDLDNRKELAIQMSESTADVIAATQAREFKRITATDEAYSNAFLKWDEQSQIVSAKLASYNVSHPVALQEAWRIYSLALLCFYNLPDRPGTGDKPEYRTRAVTALGAYLGPRFQPLLHPPPSDKLSNLEYQLAWRDLKFGLIKRRDAIVGSVLHRTPLAGSSSMAVDALKKC